MKTRNFTLEEWKIYEELTIQMKFYELESINCFITDKLRVLNFACSQRHPSTWFI